MAPRPLAGTQRSFEIYDQNTDLPRRFMAPMKGSRGSGGGPISRTIQSPCAPIHQWRPTGTDPEARLLRDRFTAQWHAGDGLPTDVD